MLPSRTQVGAGAEIKENESWNRFKPEFLSPTRVLKVLNTSVKPSDAVAQSIYFAYGPWGGNTYSVAQIFELVSGKNWALAMTPIFVGFLEVTDDLIDKVLCKLKFMPAL